MKSGKYFRLLAAAICFEGAVFPLESWAEPQSEPKSWPLKLQVGSRAYENLEFAEASRILKEVIAGLEEGQEGKDSSKVLSQAYLYLGMVYLAEGFESLAEKQFASAGLLDPGLALDSRLFSPGIIASFQRARLQTEAQGRIRLSVETQPPEAEIYFDGRFAGKSPLSLSAIPGVHYLWAETAGWPSRGQKLILKAGEDARALLELGPARGPAGSPPSARTGETPPPAPGWKKKALIIGGTILALGTIVSVILICTMGGKGSPGNTGAIFVRW